VTFDAPLEPAVFSPGTEHYIVGTGGDLHACQVTPLEAESALGYRWARLRAFLPLTGGTYTLFATGTGVRPDVPVVGAANLPARTVFDTGRSTVTFSPLYFTMVRDAWAGGRPVIPVYDDRIVNVQQGVQLVITDVFRHADFTLEAKLAEDGFRFIEGGPAQSTVAYTGKFIGHQSVPEVPFVAEVSLYANDILGLRVTLDYEGIDREAYEPTAVRVTVPLLRAEATWVTFGGAGESLRGLPRWEGGSDLSVAADGSYVFNDAEGPAVAGKGPVTWVHYGGDSGGSAFFWYPGSTPVEFAVVDYSQDLITLGAAPSLEENRKLSVQIWILLDAGAPNASRLAAIAEALREPPTAVVDEKYIRAITRAR
jgi:hypothetical protein